MKIQLATISVVLAAAGILTACGGGNSSPTAAEQKSASITQDLATNNQLADVSRMNSSDAYVLTADNTTKLSNSSVASQKISRDPQRIPSQAQTISLGSAPAESITKRDQFNSKSSAAGGEMKAKLYRTGFGRPVVATSQATALHQIMAWTTLSNGHAFGTARFESTDAAGIRLGLLIQSLPNEAMVRVSPANATTALQLSGAMINQAIAANAAADGDTPTARTYWLPMAAGSSVDLAIELPTGISAAQVSISIPTLVHMMESAPQASLNAFTTKTDCPLKTPDAMCSTPLPPAANAVAAMDFMIPGDNVNTYSCTGTLLADKGATQQPYFLTAQHCISTQTSASSLTTYWFWRSSACDSATINPNYVQLNGGATLLLTRPELTSNAKNPVGTDTSFLKLNAAPPVGAMFAGWTIQRQAINPAVNLIGLHHPMGNSTYDDRLRQSTGTVADMARIAGYFGGNTDYPSVETSTDATQPMYAISWSTGITEGGSSGSSLFLNGTTSNPQVVGQLWGGSSSCSAPQTNRDLYGRFDLAYQDGLINWLNPGYRMVFRFYNTTNGTHFYSANVAERDNVRATIPTLVHEGPAFSVAPSPASGLSPVYRFYNRTTGVHFYTISEAERASLVPNPSFQLEGVAWYARQSPGTATLPVYRFYKRSQGTHLYTVSAAERDNIIATLAGTYNYEGVAYYAWAAN